MKKRKNETSESTEIKPIKQKKIIQLKQYMIVGSKDPKVYEPNPTIAFILNTCAKTARDEFEQRTGLKVINCIQSAESALTKEDLETHDLWKENRNWMERYEKKPLSESTKKYIAMSEKAKIMTEIKAKLKIKDWDNVSEEQLKNVEKMLNEQK